MSNKDWAVGPVLKQKADSQGTLFRGGTKFSSPARFSKGYSKPWTSEGETPTMHVNEDALPTPKKNLDD